MNERHLSMKTLRQLSAELASGKTRSVDLVEAALARIESHREQGGAAFIEVNADTAREAAMASDQARRAGYVAGPLAGIPISIKDLFDVKGQTTRAGSVVLDALAPALGDAPTVARLRQAGAILIGRTNMSEFAFSGLGYNPHYGTPRTPHDPDRVSGGSSSGAAVSVASGMAAAALGTDTGGSVRIPAAFCNLTGFKPTAHRVPREGALPLSGSLDSIGPLANSVGCCATLDAVLSGQSLDTRAASLAGLRLYVTDDFVGEALDPLVAETFEADLERLSRAGARILRFPFTALGELPRINAAGGLTAAESWHWHRHLLTADGARYDQRVAQRIKRGQAIGAADYLDILAERRRLQAIARDALRDADAWLMPTVAIEPPRLDAIEHDDEAFFRANGLALRNTSVINFLDGCAASLPTDAPGVGLSICGLHDQDARVLQIAGGIEALGE